jgi:hypothetical protein
VAGGDFEKGIGSRLDVRLPYAPKVAARAAERATSLANAGGNAAFAAGLRGIAGLLTAGPIDRPPARVGWLSALRGLWPGRGRP